MTVDRGVCLCFYLFIFAFKKEVLLMYDDRCRHLAQINVISDLLVQSMKKKLPFASAIRSSGT